MTLRILKLFSFFLLTLSLLSFGFADQADAKRKKKKRKSKTVQTLNQAEIRINNLSADEQRMFGDLTKKQQKLIKKQEIAPGFNAWMVKLALGEPFYASEHHPVYTDYEEVWLYTREDKTRQVSENKIFDRQTNWPSIHRRITTKTCQIGDFFILWDRGIVIKEKRAESKVHGSCTIESSEAILPIVDGKPVEPK